MPDRSAARQLRSADALAGKGQSWRAGGSPARRDDGPSLAALVTITVPLTAVDGDTGPPGEAAGFGLLDHQTARDLVAAASRNPRTRWCLTVLHPDGTAAAHGCARGPHLWPAGPPGPAGTGEPPGGGQAEEFLSALKLTLRTVIRGPCHHQAEHSYRPSRTLRHLITARSTRCTAPGCGRPAARCDLDHTTSWDHGGPTCPVISPRSVSDNHTFRAALVMTTGRRVRPR